jgi:hypothetical protein
MTKVSNLFRWIKFLFDNLNYHYYDLMTTMTWKVEGSCESFHFYHTYENQDQGFLFQFCDIENLEKNSKILEISWIYTKKENNPNISQFF